ncbi:MAG: tyrosine-type recombinase/integrase, partial [Rhodoplanes sp.]
MQQQNGLAESETTSIAGERGRPMVKESFGTWFREACRAAGVEKSAHGLRKWFATQLAERGANVSELEAACEWRGGRMASHYTRSADRGRLG